MDSKLDFNKIFSGLEIPSLNDDLNVSSLEEAALKCVKSYLLKPKKMFFLFPSIYECEVFSSFLSDYIPEDKIFVFPYDEIFKNAAIGVSKEMQQERIAAIDSTFDKEDSILIAHISSLSLKITPYNFYKDCILNIKKGDMLSLPSLIKKLSDMGYESVDRIISINQFALRGGILDIYSPYYKTPLRIEFFGDEVDDIRFFSLDDECSFSHTDSIIIHPSSLRLLNEVSKKDLIDKAEKELKKINSDRKDYEELNEKYVQLIGSVKNNYLSETEARLYAIDSYSTLLDYLSSYECYIYFKEECLKERENTLRKEREYFSFNVKNYQSFSFEEIYAKELTIPSSFKDIDVVSSSSCPIRLPSYQAISYNESSLMLKHYYDDGYKIRIILNEPNHSNYINYLTSSAIEFKIDDTSSHLSIFEGRLSHGFELPSFKVVFLSSGEIYGFASNRSRFLSRYKDAKIIRKYEDLQEGDYVVHEVNGVGRYVGVTTIDGLEYLKIEYAGDDLFFLPIAQYRLIKKYSSREGYTPSLDKIGGSTWSRKKSRIRSRMQYLADQLLKIYSERKERPGFAFNKEDEFEKEYLSCFPHQYTKSQLDAINDVKEDMEKPLPMDRLISGDVGFGKTEIALFAAYKAILSHKQVAFLCPTTILSMQHYKVAIERYQPFGVKVELLNRYVSKAKEEEIISSLKEGKIDLLIGTHAILSDDVVFKDLGLLIIDEEQKFGVSHKEKIKAKASYVDCLTLTATPIPRTMQMSLLGVRSLSVLNEPPLNRMPVKTYVIKEDENLINECIAKELDRKGQVYYLHNSISTIARLCSKLKKSFPNKNISYIHAKMEPNEIEDVMTKFYNAEIDILVCTTIIESGLDIPNVNTIIVEDSDHFGLAQLYQIKGRVGRSSRLAYAYFLFKNEINMNDIARKRLKALKDFTELGSGYKIAMQDLNIRGAGDILGSEQSGFVDSLGYDAYEELINQVLKEKTFQEEHLEVKEEKYQLTFTLDAHIPESYGSKSQRINMYKELSDCHNEKDLTFFAKKIRDIYGPYSEEVANLLTKRKIEIDLNSDLYSSFDEALGVYMISLSSLASFKRGMFQALKEKLEPLSEKLRMKMSYHLIEFTLVKSKDYLEDLSFLTEMVNKCYYQ